MPKTDRECLLEIESIALQISGSARALFAITEAMENGAYAEGEYTEGLTWAANELVGYARQLTAALHGKG